MNKLDISEVRQALDYNPETGVFIWKHRDIPGSRNSRFAGKVTGCKSGKCIYINLNNKVYKAHRLAWAHFYGEWPDLEIDHINLDSYDNRISNLRLATRSQNEQNKRVRKDNNTGFKGVSFDERRNKYVAQIKVGNIHIRKRVGSIDEARILYNRWSSEFHREYGRVS